MSVTFPIFSSIQNEKERLREFFLKAIRLLLIIIVPVISILFISAKEFVLIFYGDKWLLAVIPIQIMCLYGMIRALFPMAAAVYLSKGRPDIMVKLSALQLILFIVFLFFGLPYGIVGVSIAVLLYSIISFFPAFYFCNKSLGINSFEFYMILLRYIVLSLIIIGTVWTADLFVKAYYAIPPFLCLILNILVGMLAYFIALLTFYRLDLNNIIKLIRKILV